MRSQRSQTAPLELLLGTVKVCPFCSCFPSPPSALHQPVLFAPAAAHQTRRTITSSSLAPTSTCLMLSGQWG